MESCVGIRGPETCEPFDVRERVGVRAELGREIEQKSNLRNTKTYKSQNE